MDIVVWQSPMQMQPLRNSRRGTKALRRRCVQRLHELGLPRNVSVSQFIAHLESHLDRTIVFATGPLPASFGSGVVLRPPGAALVLADANLSPLLRWHVWLHELAHAAWGHEARPHDETQTILRQLFPNLPAATLDQVLFRHVCTGSDREIQAEIEAEMLAEHLVTDNQASWRPDHRVSRDDLPEPTQQLLDATHTAVS